jgi:ectoine hydroxylase-related dioxygenase (phytanoyl-CoA dioxygenase family)
MSVEDAAGIDEGEYLSPFGGFWTDKSNAIAVVDAMANRGEINDLDHGALTQFITQGYAIYKKLISDELIDAFLKGLDKVFSGEIPRQMSYWDAQGHHMAPAQLDLMMNGEAKLLDYHWPSEAAQDLIFAPGILKFLELVFRDKVLAFQTLYFQRGSEQGIHQDTAFVPVARAPLEFVASWCALEDVVPGSGELLYVPKSHRLPDLTFTAGTKKCPPEDPLLSKYTAMVKENYEKHGLKPTAFLPEKGDVLFWSADLSHGGAPITDPAQTRRSMVTHYCPMRHRPEYVDRGEASEVRPTRAGGFIITKH